jgi:hypothetical protein
VWVYWSSWSSCCLCFGLVGTDTMFIWLPYIVSLCNHTDKLVLSAILLSPAGLGLILGFNSFHTVLCLLLMIILVWSSTGLHGQCLPYLLQQCWTGMIKNVKFVEEVSQEFDKDDEIVVVCALSYSIFLLWIISEPSSDKARVQVKNKFFDCKEVGCDVRDLWWVIVRYWLQGTLDIVAAVQGRCLGL